jgi:hypothetical protein
MLKTPATISQRKNSHVEDRRAVESAEIAEIITASSVGG